MRNNLTHSWLASRVCDAYYHFTVTRVWRDKMGPLLGTLVVRVSFELASREAGHISNRIDHCGEAMVTDVDSRARWYLSPDACEAWFAQRAKGYLGDLESMGKLSEASA